MKITISFCIGNTKAAELLIQNGADVNVMNQRHDNALTWSAYLGPESMVKLLIENGADINAANEFNKSALIFSITSGNFNLKILTKKIRCYKCFKFALLRFRKSCRVTHGKRC